MATSDRNLKDMMIVQRESESTHRSQSIIRTSNLENVEAKQKPLPIITARVTAQISIDQENQGMVLFEVITKSKGRVQAQAKRTYTNFSSLDTLLNAKYSKQIRSGSLIKRNLPEAINMSNIASLSMLREQLNLYIQELLKVKVIDVENGINYSSVKETKSSPHDE